MSKTTAITIIVVVLLALGGGLAWWYYHLPETKTPKITGTENNNTNLFPFGKNPDGTPRVATSTNISGTGQPLEAPQVREISEAPSSGFTVLSSTSSGLFVRFVEQETGHVYDAPLQVVSKKRVSNTTIPKTREVVWLPQGTGFIARYLGDNNAIQSFIGTIAMPTDEKLEGSLGGKFLAENISNLNLASSFSAKTDTKNPAKVFYQTMGSAGASGFISNADGTKSTKVFTSPFSEWLAFPISEKSIFLQTKSSGYAPSHIYSLNTSTGALTKILGNIIGLSSLPNKKGDLVLYSETGSGAPRLHLYNLSKKTTTNISLKTLADKCVWSSNSSTKIICGVPKELGNNVYPDAWYQGTITLSDDLWEINTETGEVKQLIALNDNSYFFDIEIPQLSENDSYLVLRNKTNNSLWSIRLSR